MDRIFKVETYRCVRNGQVRVIEEEVSVPDDPGTLGGGQVTKAYIGVTEVGMKSPDGTTSAHRLFRFPIFATTIGDALLLFESSLQKAVSQFNSQTKPADAPPAAQGIPEGLPKTKEDGDQKTTD